MIKTFHWRKPVLKKLHLICNSHIDPIWLWEWEEGAAAAVSTFRSAANLLEEYDFIFNHNEVTLYRWVEEYEPALFARIQDLVRAGKWHIMGGWYLQPDCNLPAGESLVRQAMRGREYFLEKFGSAPTTAINFDPFGHSVGLVQILKKCGYDSYLFCRPFPDQMPLEDDRFVWRGPDGSEVKCFRASASYLSYFGEAVDKVKNYLADHGQEEVGMVLWGVGNHGGGPSRRDLEELAEFARTSDVEIVHSTPERFFAEAWTSKAVYTRSLYPTMVGCYTSMTQVKQRHRALENLLYSAEKLCTLAELTQPGFVYPAEELREAESSLLSAEFHDILPGSAIRAGGEEEGLRQLEHGYELAARARAKALFAATAGFAPVTEEAYPIFVFNPHPYPVEEDVSCEFMLANQNRGEDFTFFHVEQDGRRIPAQILQEASNLNLDWRKNLLFHAVLPPFTVSRFECIPYRVRQKPTFPVVAENIRLDCGLYAVTVNAATGLVDSIRRGGEEFVKPGAFRPLLIDDTADPWGMSPAQARKLGDPIDAFTLMTPEESSEFCGLHTALPAVRIVEDGDAATCVEASLRCRHSSLLLSYRFYKHSPRFDVRVKLLFAEKDKAVKLEIPTVIAGNLYADTAFAYESIDADGREHPMQKWLAKDDGKRTFALLNEGVYGCSGEGGTLLPTLLRSAAYSAHPIDDRELIRQDRYTDRMDQGLREFSFRVVFGASEQVFPAIPAQAALFNEKPYAINLYPSGLGRPLTAQFSCSDPAVVLSACKKSGDGHLVRLYNNSPERRTVELVAATTRAQVSFGPFEVKTFRLETLAECAQMEI